ncbi:transcription factor TCP12-like [Iris pallida]|uniref:Transcription factor TCP12-like n=1 Tax=Iris pallida TaxID=29817 RepID=A0AAX6GK35_IRIPA|nr:transcription factor TCP12-like [Iris pallida]
MPILLLSYLMPPLLVLPMRSPLSPLAFVDAYNNLPFFSFEKPLPPPDPAPAEGGGRRKRQRGQRNDRHSKIRTTRGLRDRRMRLSIDIAGRFFALQDMLGLEKASATIEWLLEQSKPAIDRAAVQAVSSSGPGVHPIVPFTRRRRSCSLRRRDRRLSILPLQEESRGPTPELVREVEQ